MILIATVPLRSTWSFLVTITVIDITIYILYTNSYKGDEDSTSSP